jgi:pre-mRNA branch site protein p14
MSSVGPGLGAGSRRGVARLPPQVSRILFVRNLPYRITSEELFAVFGKYGPIRQIRIGSTPDTKGSCFVVYEEIQDAFQACSHLNGFGISGRFLVVLYYQPTKKGVAKDSIAKTEQEIAALKSQLAPDDGGGRAAAVDDELDDEKEKSWVRKR